jgi:RNA polymerase sigma factor (TIGR02999 family)
MTDVTQILNAIQQGDPSASDQLLPLVYEELRVLARQRLANEKPGQTLQATALVHEAYIRLVGNQNEEQWNSRGHFFGAAAEAMRRILVENARRKAGPEAGGGLRRVDITHVDPETHEAQTDVLALNEALDKLAEKDKRKAELVKLRFFAGLTNEQAAKLLGITPRTAYSDWGYAKAWLRVQMSLDSQSAIDAPETE